MKKSTLYSLLSFVLLSSCNQTTSSVSFNNLSSASSGALSNGTSFSSLSSSDSSPSEEDINQVAQFLYNSFFGPYPSVVQYSRSASEFPSLLIQERSFLSDLGQKLTGYACSYNNIALKGTLIISHGLGVGGFSSYLNIADYFASKGYLVFGYDATANGKSEGDCANATEQGVIDLSCAIDYVKNNVKMGALPLFLWGHSWGGYAVDTVLNVRKDVAGVINGAGFNDPTSFFDYSFSLSFSAMPAYQAVRGEILSRFLALGRQKIGSPYTEYSSLSGFAASSTKIFALSGEEDKNVPSSVGYDLYKEKYGNDPRFSFLSLAGRSHFNLYCTDVARAYVEDYLVQHPADPTTRQVDYSSFDKSKAYELDLSVMEKMLSFYQTV